MNTLTSRQTVVAMGLLAGRSYAQIAEGLGARRNAVAMVAKSLYRKFEVQGRAGLLRLAILRGWVLHVDRGLHWTRREQLVLNGLLAGRTQREIAQSLGVSLPALDLTLARMRRYAGVRTTAELLRVAVEQELAAA